MGQVLHGEFPGVSFAHDVEVVCTSKSLKIFGHLKAIIGGILKIALRCSELQRVIWWCLVVQVKEFMLV